MRRLVLRGRVVLAAVLVLAAGVTLVGVVINVLLTEQLNADANAVLRARVDAQLATVDVKRGAVVVAEAPHDEALDREAWVFVRGAAVAQPPAGPDVHRAASALAAAPAGTTRDVAGQVRLLAEPAYAADGHTRIATVVVAVSLAPYEDSERLARLGTLALGAFVVLAGAMIAWRAVGAGLRPVARMARQAATYGEHDLSRRFELGRPRDELTTLAATLDGLLDRLQASLRREQRLTAEIAHELRTPLSGIRAEAELGGQQAIVGAADRMSAAIDALLRAARRDESDTATCDLAEAVAAAVKGHAAAARERAVEIAVEAPLPACRVGADAAFVTQLLSPLLENAVRHATTAVHVAAVATGAHALRVRISDDGAGIAAEDAARVFDPGWRTPGGSGAGLGLALARRLARSLGGEVRADTAHRGASFVVELPVVRSGAVQVPGASLRR